MILATNTVLRKEHYAQCNISECTKEHQQAFECILPDARDEIKGSPLGWIRMQLHKTDFDEVLVVGDFYPARFQGFYHRIAGDTFYQDTCCWHISADGTKAEFIVHLNHGDEILSQTEHDLRGTKREDSVLLSSTGRYLYFYEGFRDPISMEDALDLVYGIK